MSGTNTERGSRAVRAGRVVTILAIALNAVVFAAHLASGSPLAFVQLTAIAVLGGLLVVQTRMIRTLKRTRELNRHAGRLELRAEAIRRAAAAGSMTTAGLELGFARLGAVLGPCAHASAEPVNLFNPSTGERDGERVAWICPECNEELPAGWSPAKTVLRAEGHMPGCTALSGSGSLSADPRRGTGQATTVHFTGGVDPVTAQGGAGGSGGDVYAHASLQPVPGHDKAAGHFADLLAEGRESCIGFCAMCAERDEQHFEELAKVGLEHCLSYCPICLYRLFGPLPEGWPTESLRKWLEENWGWKQ